MITVKSGVIHLILLLGLVPAGVPMAIADIQNTSQVRTQSKPSKSNANATQFLPPLRILAPSGVVEVQRGGSLDIPIVMPPRMGANLEIKVLRPPDFGDLMRLPSESGAPVRYRYLHRRESSNPEDTFSILVRDPLSGNSENLVLVKLLIINPKADIIVDQEGPVDFGRVPLGCPVTRDLMLQNRYGATVEGNLLVDPPWRVDGETAIHLAEGESRQVRLIFDPQATGSESTSLRIDNPMANFPQIILRGEGTAPFVIQDPHTISLSGEHPVRSLIFKNSLKTPVSVNFAGIPSMVIGDRHIELPAMGNGTLTLSIAGTTFSPDYLGKFRIAATAGAFREVIDLQIIGPKAPPSLELLQGGDVLPGNVGKSLRLEAVVRNPSSENRTVELSIVEQGASNNPVCSTLVLPPKGAVNFHNEWIPDAPGKQEIEVSLREDGRLIQRQTWHVTVGVAGALLSSPSSMPSSASRESSQVTPEVSIASPETAQRLVVNLHPEIQSGWILDYVAIQWSYLGIDRPKFRVQTLAKRNALTDRSGEQKEEDWIDVEGLGPIHQMGSSQWGAILPFLMPGSHSFRVFPATGGKVYVAPITVQVTPAMAYWPPLRAILVLFLIVLLLGVIRSRI
jgi:hypothetical protein